MLLPKIPFSGVLPFVILAVAGCIATLPAFGAETHKKVAVLFGSNGPDFFLNFRKGEDPEIGFNFIFSDVAQALKEKNWDLRFAVGSPVRNRVETSNDSRSLFYRGDRGSIPLDHASEGTRQGLLFELDSAISVLGSGDSLLIAFLTHGEPAGYGNLPAHGIAIEKDHQLAWMPISDPELNRLLETAKKKGIKIGITDFSCFSGDSVSLLSQYGCVLSSAPSDRVTMIPAVSTTSFSEIVKKKSSKMTDAFIPMLFALRFNAFPNNPQISGFALEGFPSFHQDEVNIRSYSDRLQRFKSQLRMIAADKNFLRWTEKNDSLRRFGQLAGSNFSDIKSAIKEIETNVSQAEIAVKTIKDENRGRQYAYDRLYVFSARAAQAAQVLKGLRYQQQLDVRMNSAFDACRSFEF